MPKIKTSNSDYLGYYMTDEEQDAWFQEICSRVISNPRYYLDNLDRLSVHRMSINDKYYGTKRELKNTVFTSKTLKKAKHL